MTRCSEPGRVGWRLGHRPSLDALRGVAILLVLVGHADLEARWAGAGTIGVSLFFALSGFLITGLLVDELAERGDLRLSAFYVRRAARLLPALFAFVLVMLAMGLATPAQAVPVVFYSANIAKAVGFDLGRFAATWSLAVEEQFYLVWPLALVLVFRRRAILTLAVAAALGVVGMPWAGALLGGSGLAVLAKERGRDLVVPWWLAAAAAATLVALAVIPMTTQTQGIAALASVAVVAFAARLDVRSRFLEATGRVSYGMYLWHYPIAMALWATTLPWVARFGVLAVTTYAIAGVSWMLLERPILRWRARWSGRVPAVAEQRPEPVEVLGVPVAQDVG